AQAPIRRSQSTISLADFRASGCRYDTPNYGDERTRMLFVNFIDVFHNLALSLLFPCVIAVRSRHGLSMASQPPGRRARIDVAGARTQKPAASVTAGVFKISISAGPRTGPILGDALRSMQAFRH